MKCFEVARKLLDELYVEIPGNEAERDVAIVQALKTISNQYKQYITTGGPSFAEAATRFAYVYRYLPSHAHWLYALMTCTPQVEQLFDRPELKISCFGGGPGSDLIGVLKYKTVYQKAPALFCEIVDCCNQWEEAWTRLASTLDFESPAHLVHVFHDVADRATWLAANKFAEADIFTISYFASEIYHLGAQAIDYLNFALGQAKPGAIVLVIDNKDTRVFEWLDSIMASLGFETLLRGEDERKIRDVAEKASALESYPLKFERIMPKLEGLLFWRVYRSATGQS